MTEDELKEVRQLVTDMEDCASRDQYFEIEALASDLLARYIRELERRILK